MIGTGLFNPAISNFALSSVPEHQSGLAAGANDTFRQAGIAVGVAALGALIPSGAIFGGGDQSAFVGGLHDALWVCAAVCVVGAAACWALLRDPAPAEATRRRRRRPGRRGGLTSIAPQRPVARPALTDWAPRPGRLRGPRLPTRPSRCGIPRLASCNAKARPSAVLVSGERDASPAAGPGA